MTDETPRNAATVILIRDAHGAPGVEVFLLRRTTRVAFASGMYVFPGGAVDPSDGDAAYTALSRGVGPAEASRQLGVATGGLDYWVAAIRECFEEAGVLLAESARGEPSQLGAADRDALNGGRTTLAEICQRNGLLLAADQIEYIAHWITPRGEGRRFDTRFFVARTPMGQHPEHDNGEMVASVWLSPADAVAGCRRGELAMLPPTLACLEWLTRFDTCAEVMAAARAIVNPPSILPKVSIGERGAMVLLMPGDPGYDETE